MWFHLAFNYLLWVSVFISTRFSKENHLGKINAAEQVWGKDAISSVHPYCFIAKEMFGSKVPKCINNNNLHFPHHLLILFRWLWV